MLTLAIMRLMDWIHFPQKAYAAVSLGLVPCMGLLKPMVFISGSAIRNMR